MSLGFSRIDEYEARQQITAICRRMYERGLIAGCEGNVSVLLSPGKILIISSGVNKGYLKPEQLVAIDDEGQTKRRDLKASSEFRLHTVAYDTRKDCRAVLHAHPPFAIALTIANLPISQDLIPESVVSLGRVPTALYATPSTPELADGVAELLVDHDIVMMARHGSVCIGTDLVSAFDRLESLEHTAKITFIARSLGPVNPLSPIEVARLQSMGGHPQSAFSAAEREEALIQEIVAELMKRK